MTHAIANEKYVSLTTYRDSKGAVADGASVFTGTAAVSVEDFDRVWALIIDKYGVMARGIKLMGSFMKLIGKGSGTDRAVIITLGD